MRVLELVESAAAGVGRHVADLTAGLLARGHEVHLFYSGLRCDRVFAEDLRRLASHSRSHAFGVPMQRQLCASDVRATLTLRQYLRDRGPFDLVHSHSTKAGIIGRLGLVDQPGKRVYTPHMFYAMQSTRPAPFRFAADTLETALAKVSHRIVVVSQEERAHAIAIGISPSKLCLIPNGVVLDEYDASWPDRGAVRRKWGVRETEVCVGFVGRLVAQKSPETTLRSFAALRRLTRATMRLVMVGDGPLEKTLRELSRELGIETQVAWPGECDAKRLMRAFDILVLTSVSEGHPLVVLEAMARGLPIVATAVGGIADTVQHGVNGFIAPVRGIAEIAEALEALVKDPELRGQMGQASLKLSRSFSVDRMVDQTVALYEHVLSGTHVAAGSSGLKVAALR